MNRFIIIFLVALSVLLALSIKAHASVRIDYVIDGDTVNIIDGEKAYRLRIRHIDAPERNQSYGKKSRRALMQLCEGGQVTVNVTGKDKYRRRLGNLSCGEQDVASFMLEQGHAWFNARYSSDMLLALKERTAREQKKGLWQEDKPTAPWTWRKIHKAQQQKPVHTN